MKKRRLISALIVVTMISLSFVGCAEQVIEEATESVSEEKKADESNSLQNSTEKKEADDKTEEESEDKTEGEDSLLGDLEITEKDDDDDEGGDKGDGAGVDDGNGNEDNSGDGTGEGGAEGSEDIVVTPHTVVYGNGDYGYIEGEAEQTVAHGESASMVKAVPNTDYVFVRWSDGHKKAQRLDTNIKKDISVYPIFLHKDTEFTATYTVVRAGKTVESFTKTVKVGESVSYSAPAPALAYEFAGWSDGQPSSSRIDKLYEDIELVGEYLPLSLGVPAISIVTEDGKGIAIVYGPNGKVTSEKPTKNCTVSLYNAEDGQCFEDLSARIRGRGNSSWTAHSKKGFKLKFDEQLKMLGSSYKSKNWNFISNHADKSFLRNMIAYDMSEAFDGLDYTTTHKFIDVYIDGEYYGFFMMCDDIDIGKGRIEYDKTIYADPAKTAFLLEVGSTVDNNHSHNYTKDCIKVKEIEGTTRTYCLKFPDTDDDAYNSEVHLTYIKSYIEQCFAALHARNWELVCELIDIDSFVDHYIIQELFMNKDAFWRSVYFYKAPDGKLYAGPVWDFDQGAGSMDDLVGAGLSEVKPDTDINRVVAKPEWGINKPMGSPWIAYASVWYRLLFEFNEFNVLVRDRLDELELTIKDILSTAKTDGSANTYYAKYGAAMERNFKRWNMNERVWPTTNAIFAIKTIKGQMDYMREWLLERYGVLCDHYGVYYA